MATTAAAAATTAPPNQIKIQHHHKLQQRRKCKVTTIISSTITDFQSQARNPDPPNVVSPEHNSSWCCPASKTTPTPSSPPAHQPGPDRPLPPSRLRRAKSYNANTPLPSSPSKQPDPARILLPLPPQRSYKGSTFTIKNISSSSPIQEPYPARHSPTTNHSHHHLMDYSSPGSHTNNGFTKFNSALTAGLLNPMSPPLPLPQPPPIARSSPTLFEVMSCEPDILPKTTTLQQQTPSNNNSGNNNITFTIQSPKQPSLTVDKQALTLQRISDILAMPSSPGNQFNDPSSSDISLTLSSKDRITITVNLHRPILVANSRFFATKLSKMSRNQCMEISDCDDVEVYIEALRLMYCKDLRKMLMKEDVPRVLGILKVSASIGFDAGVLSCLEYLEAAPWAEDEEEKVASLLSELRLEGVAAGEVLKRVLVENEEGNSENEEVLVKLLHVVLEGKDEKARREMKGLVTKMLRENSSHSDLRKDSLYAACAGCFELLRHHFIKAAASDLDGVSQISRQADNLHWMLDILIDRQIAEDFLKMWASQSGLSKLHSQVPAVHRHEISRVTARLFVGIGKGQLLASKDERYLLLQTWLVPFYDDFKWMKRASRGLDKNLIEDGLSSTILTLPLPWQQEILLAWFNRFLNASEDCPNIQRGFEIWWRRAFGRRNGVPERPRQFRVTKAIIDSS